MKIGEINFDLHKNSAYLGCVPAHITFLSVTFSSNAGEESWSMQGKLTYRYFCTFQPGSPLYV